VKNGKRISRNNHAIKWYLLCHNATKILTANNLLLLFQIEFVILYTVLKEGSFFYTTVFEQHCLTLFKKYDTDGNGYIDQKEKKVMVREMAEAYVNVILNHESVKQATKEWTAQKIEEVRKENTEKLVLEMDDVFHDLNSDGKLDAMEVRDALFKIWLNFDVRVQEGMKATVHTLEEGLLYIEK